MVRIMVGTLLEVGQGMKKPEEILGILEQRDRTKAGKTAPGNGLYLWKVSYDN
jgi:tRNA pseudouridine38-40 synthase